MKYFISKSNIIYVLLLAMFCACTDDLDISQSYEYGIETLPLPKSIEKGKTVALEFSIMRKGYYTGTSYKFRYFQSEGEGKLTGYYWDEIPMNRFQNILSDNFVLYYESRCEEQQQLDFVFEDNFGQRVEYSITFGNKKSDKEPDDIPENPEPNPDDEEPDDEPETVPDDIPGTPEDETGTGDGTTDIDGEQGGEQGEMSDDKITPNEETEDGGDTGTETVPDEETVIKGHE
jgi:hypothetical protein